MTNTANTTLVLDFSRVTGLARKVLVKNILNVLTLIGYKFAGDVVLLAPLDITRLVLGQEPYKRNQMTFNNKELLHTVGETLVFDVATHYDEFLTAARDKVIIRKTLDGVNITVTPTHARVDYEDVVLAAQAEAERLHKDLFA